MVDSSVDQLPVFRVIGNIDLNLSHVVEVIEFRQLMAKTDRIREGARLARRRCERRIDRDPDNVRAWWHWILPVSSVQNEKLTGKLPNISVSPTQLVKSVSMPSS